MTQDPTPYDLLQDAEISALQDIVTPYYQPPESGEMSFPVVGQGIDADQYRLMSLAQGDGIIVTDDGEYSHRLENMPGGEAETNATNSLVLKVAQNTGRGEAVIAGYYHVFYQDQVWEFPPVTTPTTYYLCITYDPREEDNQITGPVKIQRYANTLPRTHNRQHLIIESVHREPNQLLSQATRRSYRQMVSPSITVASLARLPDSTDVTYNTLAFIRGTTAGAGSIYQARGIHGWVNVLAGDWYDCELGSSMSGSSYVKARFTSTGMDVAARINVGSSVPEGSRLFLLPPGWGISPTYRNTIFTTASGARYVIINGREATTYGGSVSGWIDVNIHIPDYYYN